MVKKIIVLIFIVLVIGALYFYISKNQLDKQNIEETIKEPITIQTNFKNEEFTFENIKYSFSYPEYLTIKKSKTEQFQSEDKFQIIDKDNNDKISFIILDLIAEGPIKQSLGSKNELNVKINNIDGTRFTTNDSKDVYMLSDDKYIYLWENKNVDASIFNDVVNSFKKQ